MPPELDKVEDKTQQQQDDAEQQTAAAAQELEAEASRDGWVPKDEFKGDAADWIDAAAFVKRGKEINPILRKNNERLMKELGKANAKINELQLTQKEFGEMYANMSKNAYERAIIDVKAQIKAARKDGDEDAAADLEEQRDDLIAKSKEIKVPGTGANDAARVVQERQAIVDQWAVENPWYDKEKNPAVYFATEGIAMDYAKTPEGKALIGQRAFLDNVTEKVRAAMPEAFKNKRRADGSPVGGTQGTRSTPVGGKKTYADLPAEAKAACDRQVKNIKGFTKDKYVEYYFEQPGA